MKHLCELTHLICFLPLWPPAPCRICPFHSFDRLLPRQVQMVHTLIAGLRSAGEMCDAVMFFPCMLRRPHYSDCFLRRLNFQIRPNPHSEPMPTQETPESRASRRSAVRTISRLSSVLESPDVLTKIVERRYWHYVCNSYDRILALSHKLSI